MENFFTHSLAGSKPYTPSTRENLVKAATAGSPPRSYLQQYSIEPLYAIQAVYAKVLGSTKQVTKADFNEYAFDSPLVQSRFSNRTTGNSEATWNI